MGKRLDNISGQRKSKNEKHNLKHDDNTFIFDRTLEEYCTQRQFELLMAWEQYGTKSKAAKSLGINPNNFTQALQAAQRKAAQFEGQQLAGTSTLLGPNGEVKLQWIKNAVDKNQQDILFQEAAKLFAEKLPRLKPIKKPKKTLDENLMTCFPVGDHHLGLLVWGEETRTDDYNLEIGENLLLSAFAHLLGYSTSKYATLVFLGDFLHYDSFQPVTPTSRNLLDSDTRFPLMVRTALRCMRQMIESAAQSHEQVHVVVEIGNHDLSSSIFLMECLHNIYESNPRITVDRHSGHFHYFNHGKCLVGVHHGHGSRAKLKDLPFIMATDQPELWGKTDYRYVWSGHTHHDAVLDHQGVKVESFRILPPPDAWASNCGYRSMSDMKSIVLHKDYGEVARHTVNPALLLGAGSCGPKTRR